MEMGWKQRWANHLTPDTGCSVKEGKFPEGVYHAFDYVLFFENLKANIARRIKAFGH